ncbi:MAG: UPF0149 family protein [Ectothiorhodospiraceae bacterium]|nr:UPF0149 family protein [Ectothiorhodospiraceae bacterium]
MAVDLPAFADLEQALTDVGAAIGASESHGVLCGALSASADAPAAAWIAQVLDGTEPTGEPARRCLEALALTYQATREGLEDSNMDFQLLLPADDAAPGVLAEALGAWCTGYLFGLGSSERKMDDAALPADVREALGSLAEIARVDSEAAEESDQDAYQELVEFVRVAVLLVREQLQPVKRREPVDVRLPGNDSRTIH